MQNNTFLMVALPKEEWEAIKLAFKELQSKLESNSSKLETKEWIESTEARKMLGVSPKTWQTYRDKGIIPYVQYGRKIMVKKADLDAFMDAHYISKKGGEL